ncbi:alpha/beta hydrolase [Actinomadura atramentaria]|uniref:alpha/beta hydrolase n=1 Tax=Actinomadura atramentaria TaxID=1990 RepID=UPI00039EF6CF|nr:alpha/beta hydrolase [Actinomadura atramentaria]
MVSFTQLRDAKLDGLDAAWRSWRKSVEQLEQAEDVYRDKFLQGVRRSKWTGKDAEAALRTLVPVQERIRVASAEAASIASVLNSAQKKFQAAQTKLLNAINNAQMRYLKVGSDGSIDFPDVLPPAYGNWGQFKQVASGIQREFVDALEDARKADREIVAALGRLTPDILDSGRPLAGLRDDARMATDLAGFESDEIPPKNVRTPKEVADWWKNLPEEQRHLLMGAYPNSIGWLDGIPTEDRDEANRIDLQHRLSSIEAHGGPRTPAERRLFALQERLDFYGMGGSDRGLVRDSREVYLLGLRNDGDGRAIVAFGNPDKAKNTAVYVPGTKDDLDRFPGIMRRADRLWEACNKLAPGQTSTIAWLGYDAPDSVFPAAVGSGYAVHGAPKLDGFIDGLRQSHADAGLPKGHVTVVAHSYGSVVAAEAGRQGNGLAIDDMVTAGSPGMRVGHVKDLHIDGRHFWSQMDGGDVTGWAGRMVHGGPGGVIPGDREFGGNSTVTDTEGHSGYWNRGSETLKNQARIIVGDYGNVSLEWGRPPG